MKILLVSPQTPDTFWSFKHVLRFVSKKAAFPPLGLLTIAAMLSRADFMAFVKSFWLLGIWYRGRVAYWRFFWSTLLRRPAHFRHAIELAIVGYHFRRVAKQL